MVLLRLGRQLTHQRRHGKIFRQDEAQQLPDAALRGRFGQALEQQASNPFALMRVHHRQLLPSASAADSR